MKEYKHSKIEKKWQKRWEKDKLNQPDIEGSKKPYYNLMMFPYPSAEGLHVGNMYAFTGSDIWGRFKRMQGNDVFEPMGLDGFGIHSENYAIKIGEHIKDVSRRTEKNFYKQLHMIGNQFDWSRTVETYDPNYYKWTQWLFIQMFKNGLAFRKKSSVNWCPSCKTVLSDEQVEGGVCERCKTETEIKDMEQWFWRITKYAEKLLKNLEWINWSEEVKTGQKNWIGKSEGVEEYWEVEEMDLKLKTFTTWPHTTWGATFMVIAPEHPVIEKLVKGTEYEEEAKAFSKKVIRDKVKDPRNVEKVKEGFFLGRYVRNHLNGCRMPLYIANFAVYEYGTGIVKCTPTHDQRDFEFAKKYKLDFVPVIYPKDGKPLDAKKMKEAFVGEGLMMNAGQFNDIPTQEARKTIGDHTVKQGNGKWTVNYKLRDWCISRQRYWGAPIPMIKCDKCGWNPVNEEDLPILLPDIPEFKDVLPDGSGKGPLAREKDFVETKCPKCTGDARRETDVMDPFVDSSWYFLRYPSTDLDDVPFDKERTKKWLPVDMYIGGKEHTVLHLLYSRFIAMALKDWGFIDFEEPYKRFFGHGLLIKEGSKMSKSKGNVINPDEYIGKLGADAVRMYLMFLGDFEQGGDWRDTGMKGMYRFVDWVYKVCAKHIDEVRNEKLKVKDKHSKTIHKCIKRVTKDIERLSFNTAISHLMSFFGYKGSKKPDWRMKLNSKDELEEISLIGEAVDVNALEKFLILLVPFAPHISEELWEQLGNDYSIHQQRWPKYDKELIKEEEITIAVQINGKVRDTITISVGASEEDVVTLAKKSERVNKYLKKKTKKVIFVKDKIINFVV